MKSKLRITEKMKLPFLCMGMLLALVIFVSISACLGTNTPTKTTSDNDTSPIPTIVPKPTLINSIGNSGWVHYTNNEDHFSIYKPSEWTVKELPKSQIPNDNKLNMSMIMDKFVYIYTPNMKGFIMIYGIDASGTQYSLFSDPDKTLISNKLYEQFIDDIKLGFKNYNQMNYNALVKELNYYLINGNPARHATVKTQVNGQSLNSDFYMIAHENTYYIEGYFAMNGSTQSDASTASDILHTFTIS